ncbi:hypothetical protein GGI35DRAFT_480134 [Trichoderma velutinum]
MGRRAAAEAAVKTGVSGTPGETLLFRVRLPLYDNQFLSRGNQILEPSCQGDPRRSQPQGRYHPAAGQLHKFEIPKTIHGIRSSGAQKDELWLPERQLLFAITFSDVLSQLCPTLDCDLLVRYAHSCLIPVHVTKFRVLYAFIEITIDASHLLAPLQRSFASSNFKLPLSQEAQRSGFSLVADAIVHPRSEKKGIACENTAFGLAYILTSTLREDATIDHFSSANRR